MIISLKKQPIVQLINAHLIDYPTPSNISYFWNFGFLAGMCLVIQIVTGIALAMHYTPHVDLAFLSLESIMRDVNGGWLLRYTHANGASMFFIVVYIHIGRGLYYGSYAEPRGFVWILGTVILLLMMATAFMGYVLPWGQMSFWGATVITNLFSAFPLVGSKIVTLLWGGFSVDNATLNRFFSLHYLMPFAIAAVALVHIAAVHQDGSNNPLGISSHSDKIGFFPYFVLKDTLSFVAFIMFFSFFVYFYPNELGHPDNYIVANPMVTPEHIVPEWYEWEVYGAFSRRYCVFFSNENHTGNQYEVTTIGCYVTGLFLTLIIAINLLLMDLQLSAKSLMKEFIKIRCRKKFRFVLKMLNSDLNLKLSACLTGASTALRYSNTQVIQLIWTLIDIIAGKALKKHLELNKQIEFVIHKPSSLKKYVPSWGFALTKMRKRCNSILPARLLMEQVTMSKKGIRKFSSKSNLIECRELNSQILDMISKNRWPTSNRIIKDSIKNWVKSTQHKIHVSDLQQQLELVNQLTFDIKNRIYSIDKVLSNGSCSNYNQVGYSNLEDERDKFIMLKESKQSFLSELPRCKTVMVEIPKADGSKRLLGLSMPIDKILQQMFLNFLDIIVEKQLPSGMFAYRKGRDARSCVASAYFKLNRSLYLEEISIAFFDINKCLDNILHDKILEYYPFPKQYKWLLKRWLSTKILLIEKNCVRNIGILKSGVPRGSLIGPSVMNIILSKTFPKRVFKTVAKNRKPIWVENYSYAGDILIIGNSWKEFNNYINTFKILLSEVGLNINYDKTKIYRKINSKIKFYFLDFEFIVMPRKLLGKSQLLPNLGNLQDLQKGQKGFGVLIKPKSDKLLEIKKRLKEAISQVHRVSRPQLFKTFRLINSILFDWGQHFYFGKGCIYGKILDQFVFTNLRKALVKKFRYKGLVRPKWVAHNFIGLGSTNPNNKGWQFRSLKYVPKTKKWSYEYIWLLGDTFSRLDTRSFLINRKIRPLSY